MVLVPIVVLGLLVFAGLVARAVRNGRVDANRPRESDVVPSPSFAEPGTDARHAASPHEGGVHAHDAGSEAGGGHP